MDLEILVQNIKRLCALKGVKPTIACAESGAGKNIINQIETRGSIPSVEKIQLLAQYLGVTTSELLGAEAIGPMQNNDPPKKRAVVDALYRQLIDLSEEDLQAIDRVVQAMKRPASPPHPRGKEKPSSDPQ